LSAEAMKLPEHEVERQMEVRGREVIRLMLQAHIYARGTGEVGAAIEVRNISGETHQQKNTRVDECDVLSLFGQVEVPRSGYTAAGQTTVHPLDEQLQLPRRGASYEMQRRIVDESVRGPFDEAIENVRKTTGNRVAKRSAEQIVTEAAQDFDAFYGGRAGPGGRETGPILVGQADGKGVPMVKLEKAVQTVRRKKGEKANKKKMATVAAVYTQHPRVRSPEDVVESLFAEGPAESSAPSHKPEHKRVWASLEKDKDTVLAEVAAEMKTRDPNGEKLWVSLTDGERALQRGIRKIILGVLLILDFLHVLERLWDSAHALYDEGSEEAQQWVREHALRILQGEVSQVVKGMRQSVTKRRLTGNNRDVILKAANYLYANRHYMHYDAYLALGLPIASGAVEGACKNLVKDRMERSGMRWKIPGAEAILRLRATALSGDMQAYWQFHIQQDQQRLYGGCVWKVAS